MVAKRNGAGTVLFRFAIMCLAGAFGGLLFCEQALAASCADISPDAFLVDGPDERTNAYNRYGTVCVVKDYDQGQSDYYVSSKLHCLSLPGYIAWERDGGAGYNLCAFSVPSDGGGTTGGSDSASSDSCQWALDGACDEPTYCAYGTDTTDCSASSAGGAGGDSCQWAFDGACDEPSYCAYGTDTTDCSASSAGGTVWGAAAAVTWNDSWSGEAQVAVGIASDTSKSEAIDAAVETCEAKASRACNLVDTWNTGCSYITVYNTGSGDAGWIFGPYDYLLEQCGASNRDCQELIGYCSD